MDLQSRFLKIDFYCFKNTLCKKSIKRLRIFRILNFEFWNNIFHSRHKTYSGLIYSNVTHCLNLKVCSTLKRWKIRIHTNIPILNAIFAVLSLSSGTCWVQKSFYFRHYGYAICATEFQRYLWWSPKLSFQHCLWHRL